MWCNESREGGKRRGARDGSATPLAGTSGQGTHGVVVLPRAVLIDLGIHCRRPAEHLACVERSGTPGQLSARGSQGGHAPRGWKSERFESSGWGTVEKFQSAGVLHGGVASAAVPPGGDTRPRERARTTDALEQVAPPGRHAREELPLVALARLDEQDAHVRVLCQPRSEDAPGGPAAADDKVELPDARGASSLACAEGLGDGRGALVGVRVGGVREGGEEGGLRDAGVAGRGRGEAGEEGREGHGWVGEVTGRSAEARSKKQRARARDAPPSGARALSLTDPGSCAWQAAPTRAYLSNSGESAAQEVSQVCGRAGKVPGPPQSSPWRRRRTRRERAQSPDAKARARAAWSRVAGPLRALRGRRSRGCSSERHDWQARAGRERRGRTRTRERSPWGASAIVVRRAHVERARAGAAGTVRLDRAVATKGYTVSSKQFDTLCKWVHGGLSQSARRGGRRQRWARDPRLSEPRGGKGRLLDG